LRIVLATRPLAFWALTLVVAGAAGLLVWRAVEAADRARSQWGTPRPALVATRPIAAGEVVDGADAVVRSLPAALVPDGALSALPPEDEEAVAAGPIAAGEIVHPARLGRPARSAVAALLPAGTRGLAVPVPAGALPLRVGDVVDVVASAPGGAGAAVVAHGAAVVHVEEASAVVAVAEADAPGVARAIADGSVVLALT
jgi:Flp pilus assembly protein CpaB